LYAYFLVAIVINRRMGMKMEHLWTDCHLMKKGKWYDSVC